MVQSASPALAGPTLSWQRAAARLGGRLSTTPGRMRLAAATIIVGLLVLVVIGTGSLRARQRAANAVGGQAEPLLVGAQTIYFSLADADATATNTFLTGGLEPAARRQVYLDDVARATDQLAKLAGRAGTAQGASVALAVINKGLPTYTGLVEAARANNRLGYPVGAAYLREASTLMEGDILPAAGRLYQVEAGRLNGAYNSGQSVLDLIGVLLVAGVALGALMVTQFFVARRTNRVFNPPLLAASVLVLMVAAWAVVAFLSSSHRLNEARQRGSDPIQLLSSGRILVARAQVDENLALVARGSGSQYLDDFAAITAALGPPTGTSGLLAQAEQYVPDNGTPLAGLGIPYANYLQAHQKVVSAERNGAFSTAVDLATVNSADGELPAAAQLSTALGDRIRQAQSVFDAKASAGAHDLSRLGVGVVVLIILAAGLAFLGLEQRINEYR